MGDDVKSPGEEYVSDFIAKTKAYLDENGPREKIDVRLFEIWFSKIFEMFVSENESRLRQFFR